MGNETIESDEMTDMFEELTLMDRLSAEEREQQDNDAGLFRDDGYAYNNLTEDDLDYE